MTITQHSDDTATVAGEPRELPGAMPEERFALQTNRLTELTVHSLLPGHGTGGDIVRSTIEPVHHVDGRHVMRLVGDVDLAVADELRQTLTTALTDTELNELTVDLSTVTFLDCAGISALLHGSRVAAANAKRYDVAHARDNVRRVFELTGVLGHLTCAPPNTVCRSVASAGLRGANR
ncbi:STAS domain-containing protein [Actinoplanes sp. NPDC024001]|uniref:STAS domain-containing protein n=1 Tax=Actinoplanes sp. NPDC024001 TaxID=3154598 RepID=UPI0034073818